ncbi:MAG: diguanylate cyclase, partial [Candidatus Rokuibacteriota bacterium]
VVDPSGTVLASTAERPGALRLPPDWLKLARADRPILGEAHWDEARRKGVLAIGVPITAVNGTLLGVLAGTVNFGTVERMLARLDPGPEGHVYLVRRDGTVVVSSRPATAAHMSTRIKAVTALFESAEAPVEYADYQGRLVVGRLAPVSQMRWGVAAEVGRQAAYATIARMRNVTLALIATVLLGIGLTAYLLALTIVRPLNRLTAAAARVAADDLEVDLPVVSRGEVGYLTAVFNRMVSRLRHGREELQKLSITDGLTGLYNRRHLMETLAAELDRARELYPVSVLMIDIDHFKQYNDSHGHLAGDALLVWVATLFKGAIRDDDFAARYGGDEFLVLLRATSHTEAVPIAERLQAHVAQAMTSGGHKGVTVSVGVASFPTHGHTPEAVIARADAALYEAKKSGRNRIALASGRAASRMAR